MMSSSNKLNIAISRREFIELAGFSTVVIVADTLLCTSVNADELGGQRLSAELEEGEPYDSLFAIVKGK